MRVIDGITVTAAMLGAGTTIAEPASGETAWNSGTSYTIGAEVILASTHRTYVSLRGQSFTVTISNASPGVVTKTDHGLSSGQALTLTTTGALPTGLTAGQVYYVVNPSLNTFQLATTPTGTPINTSSAGSGTHTAVISTNLNNSPDVSPLYWRDKGPTQKFAPFDTKSTTVAKSASTLVYEITPGAIFTAVGLHGLANVTSLRVQQYEGATVIYDQTYNMDGASISSWWDVWFAPIELKKRFVIWDLIASSTAKLKLTFSGTNIQVGTIDIGQGYDIGKLIYGARLPRKDYSKKEFDDYGDVVLISRPFSRQLTGTLVYPSYDAERVGRIFDRLRSKICTWEGVQDHDDLSEPFTISGFWRGFDPAFENPTIVNASISIEGIAET